MAEPQPRRIRRAGLIFLGSFAAHLALFALVATATFRPDAALRIQAPPVIPVDMIPEPPQPKPTPPPRAPHPPHRPPAARRPPPARPPPPEDLAAATPPVESHALAPLQPQPALAPPGSEGFPAGNAAEASPPGGGQGATSSDGTPPGNPYPINPGYWQVTEHWPFIDRTERYCVLPQNIERFMAAPCNHIYRCVYPVQNIADGKLSFQGVISKRGESYDVHGGGDYSPVSLHVSVHGAGHWHLVPLVFAASLDGQFLGAECPADAKRINQR